MNVKGHVKEDVRVFSKRHELSRTTHDPRPTTRDARPTAHDPLPTHAHQLVNLIYNHPTQQPAPSWLVTVA